MCHEKAMPANQSDSSQTISFRPRLYTLLCPAKRKLVQECALRRTASAGESLRETNQLLVEYLTFRARTFSLSTYFVTNNQLSHLRAACDDRSETTVVIMVDETCREALPERLLSTCGLNGVRIYPLNSPRSVLV